MSVTRSSGKEASEFLHTNKVTTVVDPDSIPSDLLRHGPVPQTAAFTITINISLRLSFIPDSHPKVW